MSKKHNIAYIKPEEPSFLRKLKEQIGYKEGPTVDTKREDLGPVDEENLRDTEEEQPQVVVLRPGDLSAEEAAQEKIRLEKEEQEKPADLNAPIVFKKPNKKITDSSEASANKDKGSNKRSGEAKDKKSSKKAKKSNLLSFDDDEEEEHF
ncbi:hypothetical protein GWI33_021807 [Rhynchophorus ferrugineus]|uniref:DUF4604 domain-containing protein n=1 Tax=Rhynchophorus ferrugineus TaxID=354439 RepID=A0A834IQQ4_RHYFE|nr:hypothetical protein GWI33_021807 [Rhynchophorus ferrugineus]